MMVALAFGKGANVGWFVAGALAFALVVWLAVMVREVRRASELPDYLGGGEFEAVRARPGLGSPMTFSRTGMGNLSLGRTSMGPRKATSRSRRRARSRIATSPNFEVDC